MNSRRVPLRSERSPERPSAGAQILRNRIPLSRPPRSRLLRNRMLGRLREDRGTMTILITGVLVVILMVTALGVAITGVELERNELQAAADGTALAAAQGFAQQDLYDASRPAGTPVHPHPAIATRAGTAYLRTYPLSGSRTHDLRIADLTVAADGTVTVTLTARTDPPLVGWFTRGTGTSIPLQVTGHARAR